MNSMLTTSEDKLSNVRQHLQRQRQLLVNWPMDLEMLERD